MNRRAIGLVFAGWTTAAHAAPPACDEPVVPNPARDLTNVDLDVRLEAREGRARISVAPGAPGLSLQTGDLDVRAVRRACGDARWEESPGRIDVGVSGAAEWVEIDYRWKVHEGLDGASLAGWTFTWPDHCGNVFPCHPAARDGVTFDLKVRDLPRGVRAVYAPRVAREGPSYMIAWATGNYAEIGLGMTPSGRLVSAFAAPEDLDAMRAGTTGLVDTIAFFEGWLGPYPFGRHLGSVAVPWPAGSVGGMEHHPYWHVATPEIADPFVHRHEAAHGWFGNGVRIACPEDLVLSEGVSEYLALRSFEAIDGAAVADQEWARLGERLLEVVADRDTVALPDQTCGAIRLSTHPLWSEVPYLKGAFFLREVERGAGRPAFDAALAAFWAEHQGRAARMRDLIDTLRARTGYDTSVAEERWLRSTGFPAEGSWRTW